MRIAFDVDGVLADIDSALARIVDKVVASRVIDHDKSAGEVVGPSVNANDKMQTPEDIEVGQIERDAVECPPLTQREQNDVWEAIRSTRDFWATLKPLEPEAVARLNALANRHGWDILFVTQRPATAGDPAQRQSQRWLVEQGFDLPSVIVTQGSRGKLAAALGLDFLVDDTVKHCVDVIAESKTKPILVLRKEDHITEKNAERLGIKVVRSVAECLDFLQQLQQQRDHPSFLDRVAKAVGLT